MAYKSILTYLDNTERCTQWMEYAIELALKHNAKLLGIAPREIASSLYVGDFVSANSLWLEDLQKRIDADAEEAVLRFDAMCEERSLPAYEGRCVDGSPTEVLRRESLFSDLIVVGQYLPDVQTPTSVAGMTESLLMGAGRPVLVVPALGSFKPDVGNVLVAWRESKESGIALHQSLSMLKMANSVEVVEVAGKADSKAEATLDRVVSYLDLHGIPASDKVIVSREDVGNILLSHACDAGTDLLVMGGYGHARLREWALGGVTKTILETMTLPVLMAH